MAPNLTKPSHVNNDIYETLGERWYSAEDDPIALLRAESRLHNPWIATEIARAVQARTADVLDWLVRNTPPNLHILRLFLKPAEVRSACEKHGLVALEMQGTRPKLGLPFWKMLFTRRVPADFAFTFTESTRLGFSGMARKPDAGGLWSEGDESPAP